MFDISDFPLKAVRSPVLKESRQVFGGSDVLSTSLKDLCKDTETSIVDNAIIVCGCGMLSASVSELGCYLAFLFPACPIVTALRLITFFFGVLRK